MTFFNMLIKKDLFDLEKISFHFKKKKYICSHIFMNNY